MHCATICEIKLIRAVVIFWLVLRVRVQVVVNALLRALPAVGDAMLILFLFFLICSIVGVNYLKGKEVMSGCVVGERVRAWVTSG